MIYSPWIGNLVLGERLGNYGTVKFLLDEDAALAHETFRVEVQIAAPEHSPQEFEVEVFTNLNRRDFVKLYEPLEAACDPSSSYWMNYPMEYTRRHYDNLVYAVELPVTHCGAYRLTARYKRKGQDTWWWCNQYTPSPGAAYHRDCALVVSPAKTSRLSIYEANALTVEAMRGGDYQNRSTLDDFLPEADFDDFNPFNLHYVRETIGFNTLWLMPVFPITRWRWDTRSHAWAKNDSPGSPYATRDYFEINPWLADDDKDGLPLQNEKDRCDRAIKLFQDVVASGQKNDLEIFLDLAFNHAGRDVCYGQGGVDLNICTPEEQGNWIRESRPGWCTRGSEFHHGYTIPRYREPAENNFSCAVFAPADRLMEHQWYDANVDWFFGDYSCLGPKIGHAQHFGVYDPKGHAEDERDLFYTNLEEKTETAELWRYFAWLLPYWLEKTDNRLAGIRADFAQGLPNRLWEYIVNSTRKKRWDFIFLAEVLDPPAIQYRINKVFDVLTTLWHSCFRDDDVSMNELFGILEGEAQLFGPNAVVMHNGTSHDEHGNPNMWAMVARYAVAAASYGVPMVYMGQPLGLADKLDFQTQWTNMYDAWTRDCPDREPVAQMYRRINNAREQRSCFHTPLRYFLPLQSGGFHGRIFSVARWKALEDSDAVVLVFVNLNVRGTESGWFAIPRSIRLHGQYQVFNLVADNPSAGLWDRPRTAEDIYQQGVFVKFYYPNETQFLELVAID
jgi:hypothetical protein